MEILISIAVSIAVSLLGYIVIYSLKPKLVIAESIELLNNKIRITILNKGRFWAVNLRIEVCAKYMNENNIYTYHLKADQHDFLILPSGDEKTFIIGDIAEAAMELGITFERILADLTENNCDLRVRIHSYHSFSGLGKAVQSLFGFTQGEFVKKPG